MISTDFVYLVLPSLLYSLTPSLSHPLPLSPSPTPPPSLLYSLTPSLPHPLPLPPSFTHSLPLSLTHSPSLPALLTHSLSLSPTPPLSLTHSPSLPPELTFGIVIAQKQGQLKSGRGVLRIRNTGFTITTSDSPPRCMGTWQITHIRKFGGSSSFKFQTGESLLSRIA